MDAATADAIARLARVLAFVGLVVLSVRLRPWRWLSTWARGRRG